MRVLSEGPALSANAYRRGTRRDFEWQMRAMVRGHRGNAARGSFCPRSSTFSSAASALSSGAADPSALLRLSDPRVWFDIVRTVRVPSLHLFSRYSLKDVPAKLLIGNLVVTGVYAMVWSPRTTPAFCGPTWRGPRCRLRASSTGSRRSPSRSSSIRRRPTSSIRRPRAADSLAGQIDGLLSGVDRRAGNARLASPPLPGGVVSAAPRSSSVPSTKGNNVNRLVRVLCLGLLLIPVAGCAGGVTDFIVQQRNAQGDERSTAATSATRSWRTAGLPGFARRRSRSRRNGRRATEDRGVGYQTSKSTKPWPH